MRITYNKKFLGILTCLLLLLGVSTLVLLAKRVNAASGEVVVSLSYAVCSQERSGKTPCHNGYIRAIVEGSKGADIICHGFWSYKKGTSDYSACSNGWAREVAVKGMTDAEAKGCGKHLVGYVFGMQLKDVSGLQKCLDKVHGSSSGGGSTGGGSGGSGGNGGSSGSSGSSGSTSGGADETADSEAGGSSGDETEATKFQGHLEVIDKLKGGKAITIATPDKIDKKKDTDLIPGLLNGTYTILGIVAVIVIIAAGIMYITSDGDASKTATAKQAIIYALVGLVIVGSAFIITGIVQGIGTQ